MNAFKLCNPAKSVLGNGVMTLDGVKSAIALCTLRMLPGAHGVVTRPFGSGIVEFAMNMKTKYLVVPFVVIAFAASVCMADAWTNVAGNVIVGDVAAVSPQVVLCVAGGETQRVERSVFPASELKRMEAICLAPAVAELPPSAIAPAWNEFAAKCAAKTAARGDLIALKRLIAASALDESAKKSWTQKARKMYQKMNVGG